MQKVQTGQGWYIAKPYQQAKYYTLYSSETDRRIHDIPSFVVEQDFAFFNPLEWSMKKFEIGTYLGGGSFGKTYLVRERKCKYILVLKVQSKQQLHANGMLSNAAKELEIQCHMNHPNIVKMYGFFTDEERVVQILEYLSGGNLYSKMKKEIVGRFFEQQAARYMYQFLQGLQYMHQNGIAHRDIKPENILLDIQDNVKIADFGFGTRMGKDGKRTSLLGTGDYMCPEIIEKTSYDFGADMWSTGVLAFELCAGKAPFQIQSSSSSSDPTSSQRSRRSELKGRKIVALEFEFPYHFSKDLRDFINGLLKKDPNERMSVKEALQHNWIVDKYLNQVDKVDKMNKVNKKQF